MEQINELINNIKYQSLPAFKERLKKISSNYNDVPSTNILSFIERFEKDDTDWIDNIIALMNR